VATDEYDYDKAYVLRDQVRSANSATSGSSLVYDFNKLEEDSVMSAPDSVFTGKIGAEAVMAYENKHRIRSASSSVSSRGSSSVRANQTTRLFGSVARNEQVLDVIAPAGKLGLIIDTPNEGPPVVYAIKDSSILGERVCVDDRLIAIDDIDVRNMTAIEVSKLISSRNAHPERKLTLLRKKQLHSQL
jgi:C-terminal processing protease CtpA/Prc